MENTESGRHEALTALEVLKIAVGAYVTVDFVRYARSGKLSRHLTIFRGWAPVEWAKIIALVLVEVFLVFLFIALLWSFGGPVMRWGWLTMLATPADGPDPGTNLMIAPTSIPWFGVAFFALLTINLPRLARREEEVFRRGTRNWAHGIQRSFKFGMIHMVVGVPVAAGLALSFAGLFFTWRYFVGGMRAACLAHTLHNLLVVIIVAMALLFA